MRPYSEAEIRVEKGPGSDANCRENPWGKGAEIRVEDGPGSDANCRSLLGVKETKLESRMDLGLMLIVEAS